MGKYSDKPSVWLLLQILQRRERARLVVCLSLVLLGTLFELVSLSLVVPVVQVVLGGASVERYGFVPDSIEDMRYEVFVVLVLSIMVSAFLIKNLFLLASNYYQNRAQSAIGNRVNAVRDFIIMNGISPDRIVPQHHGETKPVAENTTVDGRKSNRRVDVQILVP